MDPDGTTTLYGYDTGAGGGLASRQPNRIITLAADTTTNTRYVTGPTGVAAEHTVGGTTVFPLHSPHGELWATTDPAGQITSEVDHDEFGVSLASDGQTADYDGWLASQQRADEPEFGLIQMGVRLYQPDLGRFLSVDPVYEGSANDYGYAAQDPIQNFDLDGRRWMREVAGGRAQAAYRTGRGYVGGGKEWNVPRGNKHFRWGLVKWFGGKGRNWKARVPHYHHPRRGSDGRVLRGEGMRNHRPWTNFERLWLRVWNRRR